MAITLPLAQFPIESKTLLWFAVLWMCVWILRPIATLLHELGHALPALVFTKDKVEVRIGHSFEKPLNRFGRLGWAFALRGSSTGFTGYDRSSLSRPALVFVIVGGPLASGLAFALGIWTVFQQTEYFLLRIIFAAFLCANGILFLRSVIPITLRPTQQFPKGPPSDGLDLLRTLKQTRK